MSKGFFNIDTYKTGASQSDIPKCGICNLKLNKVKNIYSGGFKKQLLIVVNKPNKHEQTLSNAEYDYLFETLSEYGIDLNIDCAVSSAVICCANDSVNNKTVACCLPNIKKTIETLKPKVILTVGTHATNSILNLVGKPEYTAKQLSNYAVPLRDLGTWLIPCVGFPFITYNKENKNNIDDLLFKYRIIKAVRYLRKKAPKKVDFTKNIEVTFNTNRAAAVIRRMHQIGNPVAFDYETNCINPNLKNAKIYTCSFSNGIKTIAFPFEGKTIEATSNILKSNIPKIASNMKFEDNWTNKILKHGVRNWSWDTMLAAHILDNTTGITSIKFQSFVLLGMPKYNDTVSNYITTSSNTVYNNIDKADMRELLLYNGLDSYLEYKVAVMQYSKLKK
jgi:uracil-DNA glycosylase family 4